MFYNSTTLSDRSVSFSTFLRPNPMQNFFCLGGALMALAIVPCPPAPAQVFERVVSGVSVERNGQLLQFPFFGGLDGFLPQFVDLDGDADLDLFVLKPFSEPSGERFEGRLALFENIGAPQAYELRLLTGFYRRLDAQRWFYFLDIDGDRDVDLYHDNGDGGLTFHRNVGSTTRADFVLETQTVTDRHGAAMANEFTSIPTFADIDADRDFDFFSGVSIGTIALYKNAGNPAAPAFEFETSRWQDLLIVSGGVARSTATLFRHGASVIEFADLDGDEDNDFFYGDIFHTSVYHLGNRGTPRDPQVAITDTLWPPSQPVLTRGYNSPRFADIDADGDLDFFVASQNQTRDNFLFYRNFGNATMPQLQATTTSFLTMLETGSYSTPALADPDGDGDQDLLIGNVDGQFSFYENAGSTTTPAFRWRTDAFQGIRVGFAATPAFADIDGDGDGDLFSGSFLGNIAFYENRGTPQNPALVLRTAQLENIDVGNASAPHFADLDRDGDKDLLVGGSSPEAISIFENLGNANAPRFALRKQIRHTVPVGDGKPFLYDVNKDGILDLLVGQRNGRILYYHGTSAPGGDDFVLSQSVFAGIQVGAAAAPALVDLNGDGHLDLIVGEEAGGLNYFRGVAGSAVAAPQRVPGAFSLAVHPNPFYHELNISLRAEPTAATEPPQLTIYNITGARVAGMKMRNPNANFWTASWVVSELNLAAGLYFLKASWGGTQVTRKLLKL